MEEPVQMEEHEKWIRACLELARQALAWGNPPVGSVIVKDGKRIGEGTEAGKSKRDITCHAEIEAIRNALKNAEVNDLRGCTLYSTHEPCLMCSYVIRHHQVGLVVVGMTVPAVGGFSSAYPLLTAQDIAIWSDPPRVVEGVLKEACQAVTREYAQQTEADIQKLKG